jgi:hypothetical protein
MQNEVSGWWGRAVDYSLDAEISMTLEKWRQRLDPLVPGIQFTKTFEGGWLRIIGYVAAPRYVLVIRSKLPF